MDAFDDTLFDFSNGPFFLHFLAAQSLRERLSGLRFPSSPHIADLELSPGVVFSSFHSFFSLDSTWFLIHPSHMLLRSVYKKYRPSVLTRWMTRTSFFCMTGQWDALPLSSSSIDILICPLVLFFSQHEHVQRRKTFEEWRRVLKPNGCLLFSCLGPDTFREIRWSFSFADAYAHTQDFPDMHDVADELMAAGFYDVVVDVDKKKTIYPSFHFLCRDLRKVGVFFSDYPEKRKGLMAPSVWQEAEKHYDEIRHEQGLPLTWELIFGHAWAGSPLHREEQQQVIQFFPPRVKKRE